MRYKEIIFVCRDNTALSPAAAAIMKIEHAKRGIENVIVRSRGRVVLFPEPVNGKMAEAADEINVNISDHVSRQLEEQDFGDSALILVMDMAGKRKIYEDYKSAINVYTIKEFVKRQGDVKLPFGGDAGAYRDCACGLKELVLEVCSTLYDEE